MATDAFGRLRTSEPFTTFNYYPTPAYNDTSDNDVWVRDVSNGGSINYDSSNNLIELSTGSGTNQNRYAIRTTKVPMDYQPGKSRLIMMSGVMMTPAPGTSPVQVFSRMGLMNVSSPAISDGVWFEVDASNSKLKWCQSVQNGVGGYTLNEVTDASWNIDKFDGTGPSGKTLSISNMNKVILIVIDQEWLGVGRLRCGFNIDGVTYYAHAFTHGTFSQAYTASPRQRLGYEIFTGTSGSSSTEYKIKQICCTCISEGGFFPLGTRNSIISGAGITGANNKLILAMRLKSGVKYKNGLIKPIGIDIINTDTNSIANYELRLLSRINETDIGTYITDASFVDISNSIVKYYAPSTQVTVMGGYVISSGFLSSRSNSSFSSNDYETLLTRAICTQYDTLALVYGPNSTAGIVSASIDFIESL